MHAAGTNLEQLAMLLGAGIIAGFAGAAFRWLMGQAKASKSAPSATPAPDARRVRPPTPDYTVAVFTIIRHTYRACEGRDPGRGEVRAINAMLMASVQGNRPDNRIRVDDVIDATLRWSHRRMYESGLCA